jgi:hypothetical protein
MDGVSIRVSQVVAISGNVAHEAMTKAPPLVIVDQKVAAHAGVSFS